MHLLHQPAIAPGRLPLPAGGTRARASCLRQIIPYPSRTMRPSPRSPARLHHLLRRIAQHNLARPAAGLHPDQVDQPQGVELLQPLEEGRVTALRPVLRPGVDRAGNERPGLSLRQLRDPPERQPLVCGLNVRGNQVS